MPSITIQNLGNKTIQLDEAVQILLPVDTVLQAIGAAGIDWMHACGAKGRCTSCMMEVLAGGEMLGETSAAEKQMQRLGRLPEGCRLACQTRVPQGDVLVRVPDENKLPHQQYTD